MSAELTQEHMNFSEEMMVLLKEYVPMWYEVEIVSYWCGTPHVTMDHTEFNWSLTFRNPETDGRHVMELKFWFSKDGFIFQYVQWGTSRNYTETYRSNYQKGIISKDPRHYLNILKGTGAITLMMKRMKSPT